MSKITEVYCCDSAPSLVPEFVDPHITVEKMGKKKVYLIEVDPNHPDAQKVKAAGKTIVQILKSTGFSNPVCVYIGERPGHLGI